MSLATLQRPLPLGWLVYMGAGETPAGEGAYPSLAPTTGYPRNPFEAVDHRDVAWRDPAAPERERANLNPNPYAWSRALLCYRSPAHGMRIVRG